MECAVCRETHRCGLEIVVCKHVFCSTCLYKWFSKKHDCPLCRREFSLTGVNVKYFRHGIKTRREKRLIEEEVFILDITKLYNDLKYYNLYGLNCVIIIGSIIDKCLIYINLLLKSNNHTIHLIIKYLKRYAFRYRVDLLTHRDKYMKLMDLLKDEPVLKNVIVLGENVIIGSALV